MQFQEYLAAILDLCKLGGVAGVGKLDTLDFLITWTPRNTNMQKNQFGQAMPTGAHFLTIRTYTNRPVHVNFTLIEMNTSKMTFFLPLKNIHMWKQNSSLLLGSYKQTSYKCQFKKESFIFHAILRHSTCFVTRLPLNPHQHG